MSATVVCRPHERSDADLATLAQHFTHAPGFLHGMRAVLITALCRRAVHEHVRGGAVLYQQGDVGQAAYVVLDGEIELFKRFDSKPSTPRPSPGPPRAIFLLAEQCKCLPWQCILHVGVWPCSGTPIQAVSVPLKPACCGLTRPGSQVSALPRLVPFTMPMQMQMQVLCRHKKSLVRGVAPPPPVTCWVSFRWCPLQPHAQ